MVKIVKLFLAILLQHVQGTHTIAAGFDCPGVIYPALNICYWKTTIFGDFADVEMECLDNGGELALFYNWDSIEFVLSQHDQLNLIEKNHIWLGVTDRDNEGVYTSTKGQPITYFNWSPAYPLQLTSDSDCIRGYVKFVTELDMRWRDQPCWEVHPGICFRNMTNLTSDSTRSTSHTPTVQPIATSYGPQTITVFPTIAGAIQQTTPIAGASPMPLLVFDVSRSTLLSSSTSSVILPFCTAVTTTETVSPTATILPSSVTVTTTVQCSITQIKTVTSIIQPQSNQAGTISSVAPLLPYCPCNSKSNLSAAVKNASTITTSPTLTPRNTDEIIKELTLEKMTLSATRRRKICVPDSRPASTGIGCVAATFLGFVLGLFLLNDVHALIQFYRGASCVPKVRRRR